MAKVPVILEVAGFKNEKREVASFKMSFNQTTDVEGQVTSLPRGGKITMRLKALNDGNSDLLHWMTDKKLALNGNIVFKNTTNDKVMKTIKFQDAYCVNYLESWEDTTRSGDLAHYEEITISCRKISNGGDVEFSNTWELIQNSPRSL